ncbi:MAG: hypothetical protein Q8P67_26665, partial [archaeon]|nr:hypothetical protein [archaeon]
EGEVLESLMPWAPSHLPHCSSPNSSFSQQQQPKINSRFFSRFDARSNVKRPTGAKSFQT